MIPIKKEQYNKLKNVYIILTLQLLVTALVVKIIRDNPTYYTLIRNYSAIPIILSFVLLFIIQLSNFSQSVKLLLLTVFSICLGTLCIVTSTLIPQSIITNALKSTFILFVSLSFIGWICYKFNINLNKVGFILLFSLFGLIIAMIFASNTPQNMRVMFTIGIIIFSLYIAYDTFRIIENKNKDAVSDALGLYLSIINLFQNLLGLKATSR